jgi:hypothetical protein
MKRQLFDEVGSAKPGLLTFILSGAKQPFPEMKQACFSVLAAAAAEPWGLSVLAPLPGFQSWIIDIGLEPSHEGKLWKFAVVQAIASNQQLRLFSDEVVTTFERAASRGPFYVFPQLVDPLVIDR